MQERKFLMDMQMIFPFSLMIGSYGPRSLLIIN